MARFPTPPLLVVPALENLLLEFLDETYPVKIEVYGAIPYGENFTILISAVLNDPPM